MWRNRNETKVQHLFLQYEVVKNKVQEDIKRRIAATASCIAEHLQGHDLAKKRVEQINKLQDERPDLIMNTTHVSPKIRSNGAMSVLEIVKEAKINLQ